MKLNINLENKILDTPQRPIQTNTGSVNIAENPNLNKGLLDTIINNGTINNYSDDELYVLISNNLRGLLLNIF